MRQHLEVEQGTHNRVHLAIGALGACSLMWLMVAANSNWPGAYLLVWVLFLAAAVPMLHAYAAGRLDLFEPITGIRVLYVMYFGAAAVYQLNTPFKERLNIAIEDGIHMGLAYAILVLLMLEVGYALASKHLASVGEVTEVPQERWNRIFRVTVVVFVIGVGARIYGVSQGFHIRFAASQTYGQYSGMDILYDYLGFFSTFGYVLMAAYSFVAPRPHAARVLVWGVMLPIQLFFAFLGGPKEYFVPILIAPLICYHYIRRNVPVSRILIPVCAMALIVFPIMTSYRSLDPGILRQANLVDGVEYAVAGVWDVVAEKGMLEYVSWSLELVVERMDGIYTFTGVILNVPDTMEYQWGKTLTVGFALLVPTFIWEDKYDYLVTVITWGERIFGVPAGGGGISITHPGELFLNFGVPGMLLGMCFLGAAFRLLHHWLVKDRRFFGIVIYAVLWPTLVIPEHPLATYFSDAAKQAGLLVLVSLAAGAGWRRQRT